MLVVVRFKLFPVHTAPLLPGDTKAGLFTTAVIVRTAGTQPGVFTVRVYTPLAPVVTEFKVFNLVELVNPDGPLQLYEPPERVVAVRVNALPVHTGLLDPALTPVGEMPIETGVD